MAINQYTFFIIPKQGDEELTIEFNCKRENDVIDDSIFWVEEQKPCNFFDKLKIVLPRGNSWDDDLIVLGKIESTCIKVFCSSSIIASVSFRIDFTTNYQRILEDVIEFCIINGLMLLDENLSATALNSTVIKQVISNSPQFKLYHSLST